MKNLLKYVAYGIMVIGVINLLFMVESYGVCGYEYIDCNSFDDYANQGFIIAMGVGGSLALTISGILFLGFSKVIEVLEDIRDSNKKD